MPERTPAAAAVVPIIANDEPLTAATETHAQNAKTAESASSSSSASESSDDEAEKTVDKKSKKKSKKREKKRVKKLKRKEKKAAKKLEKLEKLQKQTFKSKPKESEALDDRKRPYNSMYDVKAPTEDEIEEWKRKRTREEDPMLQFM